jgi:hypothetical protein
MKTNQDWDEEIFVFRFDKDSELLIIFDCPYLSNKISYDIL